MQRLISITIFCLLFAFRTKAQEITRTIVTSKADSLKEAGDLKAARDEYKKNVDADPSNQINVYNYACVLSIGGELDSSFKYLDLAIQAGPLIEPMTAILDKDFLHLHEDKRWDKLESKLISKINLKEPGKIKDVEYAKKLWNMIVLDQAYYDELETVKTKIGPWSNVSFALWDLKGKINHENQQVLETLILQKGWPKISQVGKIAAKGSFLIIQHSSLELQKKYLPIIEKLCQQKEASWESYALMYDRIQTDENKPQKYGSQVRYNELTKKWELFPLEDYSKVDIWRKEVELGPLTEYVSQWGIILTKK